MKICGITYAPNFPSKLLGGGGSPHPHTSYFTDYAVATGDIQAISKPVFHYPKQSHPKQTMTASEFSPINREMSAHRHAISKLHNKLAENQRELEDLKKENRLLNRLRLRQERALDRFQSKEGDLPQLLARHAEEVWVSSHACMSWGAYIKIAHPECQTMRLWLVIPQLVLLHLMYRFVHCVST